MRRLYPIQCLTLVDTGVVRQVALLKSWGNKRCPQHVPSIRVGKNEKNQRAFPFRFGSPFWFSFFSLRGGRFMSDRMLKPITCCCACTSSDGKRSTINKNIRAVFETRTRSPVDVVRWGERTVSCEDNRTCGLTRNAPPITKPNVAYSPASSSLPSLPSTDTGGVEDEGGGDSGSHDARVQGKKQPQGHCRVESRGRGDNMVYSR